MRLNILMISLCAILGAQGNTGAAVSGSVVDQTRKAIGDAFVVLSIIPVAPPAITLPFHSVAKTGKDGKFLFENVPVGEFRVCAQVPGSKLLNPCNWPGKVPTVKVSGRAAADAGTIELAEGYLLEVNVTDDQGLVAQNKRRQQEAHLSFGVGTGMDYQVLAPTPGKPENSQYSYVVPYDMDLELITHASVYVVADQENKSEARGKLLVRKLRFAKGDPPKPVAIVVSGVGGAK